MLKSTSFLFVYFFSIYCVAQKPVVIKDVTIIDMVEGKVKRHMTVTISGNKISSVSEKLTTPRNATIINGKGKYLIPGLWDMHAHALTDNRYEYTFPLLLANGITGIREMGSNLPYDRISQIREDLAVGKVPGPRLGAVAYRLFDGTGSAFGNVAVEISTPNEGRAFVKEFRQKGADFIKPYNLLSREVYLAIVDEATRLGIPLEGHAPFSMTPVEVSDLGQKSIEHNFGILLYCSRNSAELQERTRMQPTSWAQIEAQAAAAYDSVKANALYQKFVQNGTWTCPTIVAFRPMRLSSDSSLMLDSKMQFIPAGVKEGWHQLFTQRLTKNVPDPSDREVRDKIRMYIVYQMHKAGVPLLAGTDMPNPFIVPGFSLHEELELMVQSGLSPLEALKTATINPAIFLGKDKELGTVESGKLADLVLLNANPLEAIGNTRQIFAVIANGQLFGKKDLAMLLERVKRLASN